MGAVRKLIYCELAGERPSRSEHELEFARIWKDGAALASTFVKAGLIDEYRLFVNPVVIGAGTPFFPPLDERIDLELLETWTFGSRVVYIRYGRAVE